MSSTNPVNSVNSCVILSVRTKVPRRTDLDQPEAIQLLNGFPDGGPTDAVPLDQLLLRGELTTGRERPAGDQRRQIMFDLKVKRDGALRVSVHTVIMT